MSVLVVGSSALDTVETPFDKVDDAIGGSAIYFSTAASYFTDVHLVAVVGNDFPMNKIQYLNDKKVDLSGLQVVNGKTFRWGGRYNFDANERETLFTHLNVFENFDPVIPGTMKDIPYVFLANIQPELQLKVLEQMNQPKLVVLDTMNFWIERTPADLKTVLQKIDILIINDTETQLLGEHHNIFKAAKNILSMGPRTLIIKKGEHGAILIDNDSYFCAPAFPLADIFDPTGAGDTFAGGFVGYLAKTDNFSNETLRKAIIYGSTLGSFCVQRFSVDGIKNLTTDEIQSRYNKFIELTRF